MAGGRGRIVKDQVPVPVPLKRFDMAEPERGGGDTSLIFQDSLGGVLRMLRVAEEVIGEEPTRFAVIGVGVHVTCEQDSSSLNKANIRDEFMHFAWACFHLVTPFWWRIGRAAGRPRAAKAGCPCASQGRVVRQPELNALRRSWSRSRPLCHRQSRGRFGRGSPQALGRSRRGTGVQLR